MRIPHAILPLAAAALCATALADSPPTIPPASIAAAARAAASPGDPRSVPDIFEDSCGSPNLITGLGLFSFDNSNATTDGNPHPACAYYTEPQTSRDVWALWTAPVSGQTTIDTCGLSNLDTKIVVYRPGAFCSPTDEFVLACDDDGCGQTFGGSTVTFIAFAGQKYLVRVGIYPGQPGGVGQIRFTCAGAQGVCALDDCQNPALASAYRSDNFFYRVADNFTAPESGDITSLCWWGVYTMGVPDADSFEVTYWTDASNFPGMPIASFTQGAALAISGSVPTGRTLPGGFPEQEFSACHPAVHVFKGQKVWIQIVNKPSANWYWSDGAGPDNRSLQDASVVNPYTNALVLGDRALCVGLVGCPVDTNGDHTIDFIDLNNILSSYGAACP